MLKVLMSAYCPSVYYLSHRNWKAYEIGEGIFVFGFFRSWMR
jgi:hypothetical protein